MPCKRATGFRNCALASVALCCVIILLSPALGITASADADTYSFVDTVSLALKGGELSEQEAQQLEEEVKDNPENLPARIQLLGYYSRRRFDSDDACKARQEHILWIIQHHPDSEIAGLPYTDLNPVLDGKSYYKAKELWLKQVKNHSENAKVLGNAANFFLHYDEELSEMYLKEAQTLEPKNPDWPKRLGFFYMLQSRGEHPAERKSETARKALKQYEKASSLSPKAIDRFYLLSDLAEAAFEAQKIKKAQSYARELLEISPEHKDDWNYGNAIHNGNTVLGRIAIRRGDAERAADFLLKAGATPGSPQLNSFGPDFVLAKELLEKGEKKTVIEYLKLCKNFWKEDVLDRWIRMIEADIEPDFERHWSIDDWEPPGSANGG